MRLSYLPLVAAALAAGCLGPSLTDPIVVSDPASLLPFRPDCTIANWADACTARASANDAPSKAEIDLAVNPKNPLNVFVASKDLDPRASDCVWSVGQVTKDGGKSWKTVYAGGTLEDRMLPTHPMFGVKCVTDPILSFDSDGILYYPLQACCYERTDRYLPNEYVSRGPGSHFFLAVSRDGGETFPTEDLLPIAVGDRYNVFHDYPRMLVNPKTKTVSMVWALHSTTSPTPSAIPQTEVDRDGHNAFILSTRDQGKSVGAPTILVHPQNPRYTSFASGFTATNDGTVYITVWLARADTVPRVPYLAWSRDDARTFEGYLPMFEVHPPKCPLPNTKFRCGAFVELAADTSGGPHDGRLHAVWADGRNGDADAYASWSDDRGRTWSPSGRVNGDATNHAQWMPRVRVGPDGTAHILYLDRQHDAGDRLYDATYAWSTDGGLTWGNHRITSVGSDGDLGIHQYGGPFIGDYVGLAAAGDHVYLGFPSTATGRTEIAVAHLEKPAAGG